MGSLPLHSRSTASWNARSSLSVCTTSGMSRSFSSRRICRSHFGQTVRGEIARFIAGDPTAGNMTGGYLFKMWGLPAAAAAITLAARPENRAKIGGIMISAALTAFLTGITEPIAEVGEREGGGRRVGRGGKSAVTVRWWLGLGASRLPESGPRGSRRVRGYGRSRHRWSGNASWLGSSPCAGRRTSR